MVVSERMVVIGDKFGNVDDSDRVATPMYESSVLVLILNLKYFCECFTFSQHFSNFDRGFTPFHPGSAEEVLCPTMDGTSESNILDFDGGWGSSSDRNKKTDSFYTSETDQGGACYILLSSYFYINDVLLTII